MVSEKKSVIPILAILAVLFAATTAYLLVVQIAQEDDTRLDDEALEFLTDKTTYEPGENVTFILLNDGTDDIKYDSELRETLQIFGLEHWIAAMVLHIQTFATTVIGPGENLSWTWNQTYYLYVWEEGKLEPTWDYRSWTQVPDGRYVAEIDYGDIRREVEFSIGS